MMQKNVFQVSHFLLTALISFLPAISAQSQVVFEDFLDGEVSDDSAISWMFVGEHSISNTGLQLTATDGQSASASGFFLPSPQSERAWSIRLQGRLLQDSGAFGVFAPFADKTSTIDADGVLSAVVDRPELSTPGRSETDLNPNGEDVILQVDYVDRGFFEFMNIQAWSPVANPDSLEVTEVGAGGLITPSIWLEASEEEASLELRWVAFLNNDHFPVNIPIEHLQLDCDYQTYWPGQGLFDNGLPTTDEILTAADVMCSTKDTIGPLLEITGVFAGDANLDGLVNFSDFLTLSSHFGTNGGWVDGDFDRDGAVQFPDFLLLSANFGQSSATRSVPEPDSSLLLFGLAFISRWVERKSARRSKSPRSFSLKS